VDRISHLRPKKIRPIGRNVKANYFLMHVYDQERVRLEAERSEILKRITSIDERVKTIVTELGQLEHELKEKLLVKMSK